MIILDSSAIIALIEGKDRGDKVLNLLSDTEEIAISVISIAEVTRWCIINKMNLEFIMKKIIKAYSVLDLTKEIAQESGKLVAEFHKSKGIGMVDAIIYATAKNQGAQLITLDSDFKDFKGTKFIS